MTENAQEHSKKEQGARHDELMDGLVRALLGVVVERKVGQIGDLSTSYMVGESN